MKTMEAVKKIMDRKGLSLGQMAYKTGLSKEAVHARLRLKNISVIKLRQMLTVLDYKIVIMPQGSQVYGNCFEIE